MINKYLNQVFTIKIRFNKVGQELLNINTISWEGLHITKKENLMIVLNKKSVNLLKHKVENLINLHNN